jgi:hypothetical protein
MRIILEFENEQERRAFLVTEPIRYFTGRAQILASNYAARKHLSVPILLTAEIDSGTFHSEIEPRRLLRARE